MSGVYDWLKWASEATNQSWSERNRRIFREAVMEIDSLRAELTKAEQMREDLRKEALECLKETAKAKIQFDLLRAELAEARKDTARLDWVLDGLDADCTINNATALDYIDMDKWAEEGGENNSPEVLRAWRAAIDEAMK